MMHTANHYSALSRRQQSLSRRVLGPKYGPGVALHSCFFAHCTCVLHFVLIILVSTIGGQHWRALAFSGSLLCLIVFSYWLCLLYCLITDCLMLSLFVKQNKISSSSGRVLKQRDVDIAMYRRGWVWCNGSSGRLQWIFRLSQHQRQLPMYL